MQTSDTRLTAAMRAMLAIIAGQIVSNLLQGTWTNLTAGAKTRADAWANALVFLAATVFVFRVLIDNILYYNDADVVTGRDAYPLRGLLIVLDLLSYGFCNGIVTRLTSGDQSVVPHEDLRWAIGLFVGVETLHFIWCSIALGVVKEEPESDPRKSLLRNWRSLSGTWAVIWLIVAAVLIGVVGRDRKANVDLATATVLFALSVASAVHYLARLRGHYMGQPRTPSS